MRALGCKDLKASVAVSGKPVARFVLVWFALWVEAVIRDPKAEMRAVRRSI
jgi:hypothetical protein